MGSGLPIQATRKEIARCPRPRVGQVSSGRFRPRLFLASVTVRYLRAWATEISSFDRAKRHRSFSSASLNTANDGAAATAFNSRLVVRMRILCPCSTMQHSPGKMDTLEHLTAFALRCRAFWDKVMGVQFLLCDPAKYEAFAKNSSRKRFFAKHATDWPDPPSHLIRFLEDPNFRGLDPNPQFPQILERVMENLDAIRTAEAHGTGMLRKSTLGTLPIVESDHATLLTHYNIALGTMRALRRTLEGLARR